MANEKNASADPKAQRKARVAKVLSETATAAIEVAKAATAAPAASVTPPVKQAEAAPQPQPEPVQPPLAAAPAKEEVKAEAPASTLPRETEMKITETGATKMTDTINNTVNQAQEATQQAAAQFRGAMSDANERGKAALEKSARVAEEMADLTRGNLEAFVASSKTAAKYVETLAQGAADYSRRSFEEASTALRSFTEVKSPTDFFRLQSDYARSAFDSIVAETARVSETVVKMGGEVAEPLTSRYAVAADRLKTIAA